MLTPTCDRCGRALEELDLAAGATVGLAPERMRILHLGDVCLRCGKVACGVCRGRNVGAPCDWCGGPTKPAYEDTLRRVASLGGGWPEFRYIVGLLGGLGGLGGAIALYPLADSRPPQSMAASVVALLVGVASFAIAAMLDRASRRAEIALHVWRVAVSVFFGGFGYYNILLDPRQPQGGSTAVVVGCITAAVVYLATWPISRVLRRKRLAEA